MADTAARLAISARRNEVARFTIAVTGIDMTGVAMAMQIRLGRDVPGVPLIALATVSTLAAEGLKLDGVTVTNGIPTSIIKGRINASTMTDATKVPYAGEMGDNTTLAYAMQWTMNGDAQTRLYGDFVVLGSAFGSDNTPTNRPASYGATSSAGGSSSGSLSFGDQVVQVTISDVDTVAAIAAGAASDRALTVSAKSVAEAARDAAAADAIRVAQGLAVTQATRQAIDAAITAAKPLGVLIPAAFTIFDTIGLVKLAEIPSNIQTVGTRGFYKAGDGASATFRRVYQDLGAGSASFRSADRYLPDGTVSSANGGWWIIAPEDNARLAQFGAVADTTPVGSPGSDNVGAVAAFTAYQATDARNLGDGLQGGRELRLADGGYYFASSISVKITTRFRGMGVGQAGGEATLLRFAQGVGGFIIERKNTLGDGAQSPPTTGGDGSLLDGLLLQSSYVADSTYKPGVRFRARGTVQNSVIRSFAGAGLLIAADTSVPPESPSHGNANNSVVSNVRVQNNLDGVNNAGGDANVVLLQSVDASGNRRWGFVDTSFLAITLVNCHADANGNYNSITNTTSLVSYANTRWSVRAGQDAQAATTVPGSDDEAVWLYEGGGGPVPGMIPAWELNGGATGTTYRAGGAYYINPVGATTPLIGCYYETGQARPQVINGIVIGGFMGKGLIYGGPHCYASPLLGFTQQRPFSQQWTYRDGSTIALRFGGNLAENADLVTILNWGTSQATPDNPDQLTGFSISRSTGDFIATGYDRRSPFRICGLSTRRTYGGRDPSQNQYVVEIDALALGNGQGAGDGCIVQTYEAGPPTEGKHALGEIVWNNSPSPGAPMGWMCVASGSPGIWRAMASLAA